MRLLRRLSANVLRELPDTSKESGKKYLRELSYTAAHGHLDMTVHFK